MQPVRDRPVCSLLAPSPSHDEGNHPGDNADHGDRDGGVQDGFDGYGHGLSSLDLSSYPRKPACAYGGALKLTHSNWLMFGCKLSEHSHLRFFKDFNGRFKLLTDCQHVVDCATRGVVDSTTPPRSPAGGAGNRTQERPPDKRLQEPSYTPASGGRPWLAVEIGPRTYGSARFDRRSK